MAMKPCSECKTEISSSAASCPKCGAPQKKSMGGCATAALVVVGTVILIVAILAVRQPTEITTAASTPRPACDVSRIEIKSVSARFVDECRTRSCIYLKGVAVLTNRCDVPVGVEVKITGLDASGSPMATRELWPASTRNIPPGDYTFSIDQWLDHQPGMKSVLLQPIDVRQWD